MSVINKKRKVYVNVVFFEEDIRVRVRDDEKLKIKRVCKVNKDVFNNLSHYVRCAIIKDLRNYDSRGKRLVR